jgi:hypothetical protein
MKNVLNKICVAFEAGTPEIVTACVMYDIAREAWSAPQNTFSKIGVFLIDNAEQLEKDFDTDNRYGRAAYIPNVSDYIWSKFQEYNRINEHI